MANILCEEPVTIPTLGRPFRLGMLYDCRSETTLQGITLWDQKTLDGKVEKKHESADFEMISSDTIEDKSSALDVNIGLKLSFLGGLLTVSGSGRYLDNRKSSNHVERVTLKYKCTTKTEEMTMEQLGKGKIEHPEVFDHGTATHVVTGITYGGSAFFVFDKELSSNTSGREVSGNLQAMIKSIPMIEISGKGELALSEDEKKEACKFTCRYFGDFLPRENPSSFEEAVRLYKKMPNIIGENGENAVPTIVSLYPLSKLDSKACKLVREISSHLVKETENYLENLYCFNVKCNDLLRSEAVNKFRGIKKEIQKFQSLLTSYKLGFQKELAQILPGIRGGSKEESELADILKKREASPFSNEALDDWMELKESQVNILLQYTSTLSQISFASRPGDLQAMVMSPNYKKVLCLSILMPKSNSYLINMSKYLNEEHLVSDVYFTEAKYEIPLTVMENESTMMEKARHFRDLFDIIKDNTDVGFIVAEESSDLNEFQAKIRYYDNGRLYQEDFAIPSAPSKVRVNYSETTHDSIMVQWEKPHGASNIIHYNFSCESTTGNNSFVSQHVDCNATSYLFIGLKPCCEYQISAQSVCELGVSHKDTVNIAAKTRPTSPPVEPEGRQIQFLESEVRWSKPLHIGCQCTGLEYVIKQQEEGSDWGNIGTVPFGTLSIKKTVNPNVTYRFKVNCECRHCGKSLHSKISNDLNVKIKPDDLLKSNLCKQSKKIQDGNIIIYQPNLELITSNKIYNLQKFKFGKEKDAMQEKVIMLVGSTGSGKTTLINGIINYIFCVNWDDNFRFKLITEPESHNQAKSQTRNISSYTIHHQEGFKVPYTLTVIDTPGFGDVQGIERDKEITDQMRTFFQTEGIGGIEKLDAVGFVVQSALPRLTLTQKYIFNQILSLFGKDIADNIFMLLTFADNNKPQVLSGIKEASIPYRKFFKFNNAVLYTNKKAAVSEGEDSDEEEDGDEKENNDFNTLFWNVGKKNFKSFFENLNLTESKSLTLTKDVLNERHQLEVLIAGIRVDIQIGLSKLEQLRKELDVLTTHQIDVDRNKNFTYTVTEETFVKESIPSGQYITNCLDCNRTCHEVCQIRDDAQKRDCWAMSDGYCRICPGNCSWELHKNFSYKIVCKLTKVEKSAEELRRRYEEATKKSLSAENLIKEVNEEFEAVQLKVLGMAETVRKSLQRLKEIALKPNPLSTVEYIDILIESEKSQADPEWQARVKQLQNVRKQAEYMKKVADQGFDPFVEVKKKIKEEKKENKREIWCQVQGYLKNIFK